VQNDFVKKALNSVQRLFFEVLGFASGTSQLADRNETHQRVVKPSAIVVQRQAGLEALADEIIEFF
jgi:hypothetical protein